MEQQQEAKEIYSMAETSQLIKVSYVAAAAASRYSGLFALQSAASFIMA